MFLLIFTDSAPRPIQSISCDVLLSDCLSGSPRPKRKEIMHSISNMFFQCVSYILERVHQNSPSMHFRRVNTDSGGSIRIQEGQYGFRRANTDSGGPIRNRICILGRPIRNRLCISGGPIRKPIRNRM